MIEITESLSNIKILSMDEMFKYEPVIEYCGKNEIAQHNYFFGVYVTVKTDIKDRSNVIFDDIALGTNKKLSLTDHINMLGSIYKTVFNHSISYCVDLDEIYKDDCWLFGLPGEESFRLSDLKNGSSRIWSTHERYNYIDYKRFIRFQRVRDKIFVNYYPCLVLPDKSIKNLISSNDKAFLDALVDQVRPDKIGKYFEEKIYNLYISLLDVRAYQMHHHTDRKRPYNICEDRSKVKGRTIISISDQTKNKGE